MKVGVSQSGNYWIMLHTGILFTNKEWVSKGTASWSCMKLVGQPYYKIYTWEEERRMKLEKGKEMHRKIRKGKERRAQPLSVSGQRNVSIILQRQISPKQFPPATGDQRADENRDMQHITFEGGENAIYGTLSENMPSHILF